jgi:hypothetical protein
MSKKKKNLSSLKEDADDVSRSSSASEVMSPRYGSYEGRLRYLLLLLILLGFLFPFFYYYIKSGFSQGRLDDRALNFHEDILLRSTDSRHDFVDSILPSPSMDPYLIHMTKSTKISDKTGEASGMSKSRINSSTYGGMTYPSYKYYYYDVYSQSFRLYPQSWDTEEESDPSVSLSAKGDLISALSASTYGSPKTKYSTSLCDDGLTTGYSDWTTLRHAIHERNDEYQKFYSRWSWFQNAWSEYEMIHFLHPVPPEKTTSMEDRSRYNIPSDHSYDLGYASSSHSWIEPPHRPYESVMEKNRWRGTGQSILTEPHGQSSETFVICPGAHLKIPQTTGKTSIFINSESFQLECDGCIIHGGGTHLVFGPQAKNVWIKGVTFTGATTSSLVFPHSGAEVSFLRCSWFNNRGLGSNGAVLDLISTRYVIH